MGDGVLARVFNEFDLLDAIGVGISRFAGVPPGSPGDGPRLDASTFKGAAKAIANDPRKRRIFLVFMAVVAAFTTIVGLLLVNGTLGDLYESVWSRWPGRPWTHVMRERPWIYALLAGALGVVPFLLAPRNRWGRAFLTYVIFLIGFLGGHVFW